MKVGDKVWVETNWQQQLDGAQAIAEGTAMALDNGFVEIDFHDPCLPKSRYLQHAVSDRKEDIVRRVRERLDREKHAAERSIWEANKAAIAAGQALAEFEEKYGS